MAVSMVEMVEMAAAVAGNPYMRSCLSVHTRYSVSTHTFCCLCALSASHMRVHYIDPKRGRAMFVRDARSPHWGASPSDSLSIKFKFVNKSPITRKNVAASVLICIPSSSGSTLAAMLFTLVSLALFSLSALASVHLPPCAASYNVIRIGTKCICHSMELKLVLPLNPGCRAEPSISSSNICEWSCASGSSSQAILESEKPPLMLADGTVRPFDVLGQRVLT